MLSGDSAGDQFFVPNIVRALGQALVLTPISAIATAGIAPSEAGAASGLSNMLRNLGGAIGTATLATIITKREQFHSNVIGQSISLYSEETRRRIAEMTGYFEAHGMVDRAAAQHQAIVAIGKIVHRAGADHGLQRRLRRRRRRACASPRLRSSSPARPMSAPGRRAATDADALVAPSSS